MLLTHYYANTNQLTFLDYDITSSIMDLDAIRQKAVADELSHYPDRALLRFRNFDDYIERRKRTEEWLYSSFLKAGGRPYSTHPFYFVLDTNKQLEQDFGQNVMAIQLDTDKIKRDIISFTLGDSMGVYASATHKVVYTICQIESISSDLAFLQEQLDELKPYHRYIEAQLWDRRYLKDARRIGCLSDNMGLSFVNLLLYNIRSQFSSINLKYVSNRRSILRKHSPKSHCNIFMFILPEPLVILPYEFLHC